MHRIPVAIALRLLAFFLLCPSLLMGQRACEDVLRMTVQSKEEDQVVPVIGATVGIGDQYSITDINGYVEFSRLCVGKLHVHIHALGYQPVETDIMFQPRTDTLQLFVRIRGITLDNVEIKGHRQALQTANTSRSLYREELDKLRGGNLAATLSAIPGVRNLQTGASIGKPVIQGMHSNRVLILNNGIRQEGQQWGSEHAPEIDPFIAQSVTVVKGAEGVRYGSDAIGGVVLMEPASLPTDSSLHAEINMVAASNGKSGTGSAMLSGQPKKWPQLSWRLQGTLKRNGNFKTAAYFLENSGAIESNYSAAMAYNREHMGVDVFYSHFRTKLGIFKGAHIGSVEDLLTSIERGRPYEDGSFSYEFTAPRQEVYHDLLKVKSHIHLSDYWHLNAQYGWQRDNRQEYDIRRGGRGSLPSMDLFLATQSLDLHATFYDGHRWKAILGAQGQYQNNSNVTGTLTTPLIPDYISNSLGVYAIGRRLYPQYEVEAGFRYDIKNINALGYNRTGQLYGSNRSFQIFTGSIGGVWHMNPQWDLRSNMGTAWRAPTVNELYSNGIHQSAGAYEVGDSLLSAEKSLKWTGSLQYRNPNGRLRIDLDLYAHYIKDYIYLRPTGTYHESLSGSFPIFQQSQADARFLGADLTAVVPCIWDMSYTLNASVLRAKDLSSGGFLPLIPADRVAHQLEWAPPALGWFQKPYVQLAYVFVARQNRYNPGADFAAPPPATHLLNFNMGSQWSSGKHEIGVHFSIDNLTNALYKDYLNGFRYFAHDLGRSYVLRLNYRI